MCTYTHALSGAGEEAAQGRVLVKGERDSSLSHSLQLSQRCQQCEFSVCVCEERERGGGGREKEREGGRERD